MIYIGIDPVTHTGVAFWNSTSKVLFDLYTLPIHRALEKVKRFYNDNKGLFDICVVFEDARQRKWYGKESNDKLQGAGSVKRDCSIWEGFCKDEMISYLALPPIKGGTKVSESYFKTISGWKGRTSNHARDAAMLVLGR